MGSRQFRQEVSPELGAALRGFGGSQALLAAVELFVGFIGRKKRDFARGD